MVLVETKLHVPAVRRPLVTRPRLSERLGRGAAAKLTLISAPAGFGKTTLLSAWLATAGGRNRSVAWLSLEESDRDPAAFWTYVINALQRVVPGVGDSALPLLQSAQPPIEALLTTVINELSAAPDEVDLVLDDFHLADGEDVHTGLVFLLEHLPAQVHLVISTRADPALPLARLRARGELVEIRAADLRFTVEEAAAYLTEVIGLSLSPNDIAVLAGRTEGWIAALQLAALSMEGRADVTGFIAGFAGDDRYIVDYLVEEVLARQPAQIRDFLIRTAILDRLSGPLCDAVTGTQGGKAMLDGLDRANLFVVPLDDNRQWYRYHQLFADVLYTRLLDEQPERIADLHGRASQWYEQNGEPFPAVRHALAAGDVERAAGLVELAIPALRRNRQEATIRGWLGPIPDDVIRARPVLAVGLAGALVAGGEFDGVEDRLADAEQHWNGTVVDEDEFSRLPADIALYRAALALAGGDVSATHRHAQLAIDSTNDSFRQAAAAGLRGLAFWGTGDLDAAHGTYLSCVDGLRRSGHISDVLGCSITLADIRITQGRLSEASRTYEQALQLASPETRGVADMHVGLSQILCERNDLDAAARHLSHSSELGEHTGLPQNPYRWRVAMAQLRVARGDLVGALDLLDEAQRVYIGDFSPNVRPIPALRARVLAAQGKVGEALRWAQDQGLSADDELSYLREFEHITLARILLAQGDEDPLREADRLLRRLRTAAEDRIGNLIEILVLQALTQHALGEPVGALLDQALALAEPENYVRVFTGEGAPMFTLLKAVVKKRPYVRMLLDAMASPTPSAGLVDPLSDRELDVLRLLATDLDGPDIARRLTVSLNTLRTHTRNIYAKLGVNNRRAAVRAAGEHNLL